LHYVILRCTSCSGRPEYLNCRDGYPLPLDVLFVVANAPATNNFLYKAQRSQHDARSPRLLFCPTPPSSPADPIPPEDPVFWSPRPKCRWIPSRFLDFSEISFSRGTRRSYPSAGSFQSTQQCLIASVSLFPIFFQVGPDPR